MTLAHQIAERIHALRYEDLSNTALEWTSHAFIDSSATHHHGHPRCRRLNWAIDCLGLRS
jgi:hypothetical protein